MQSAMNQHTIVLIFAKSTSPILQQNQSSEKSIKNITKIWRMIEITIQALEDLLKQTRATLHSKFVPGLKHSVENLNLSLTFIAAGANNYDTSFSAGMAKPRAFLPNNKCETIFQDMPLSEIKLYSL